jgi:hypothetical protein
MIKNADVVETVKKYANNRPYHAACDYNFKSRMFSAKKICRSGQTRLDSGAISIKVMILKECKL